MGNGKHTKMLLKRYGNICHLCGKEMKPEEISKDHLIPKSKYTQYDQDFVKKSWVGNIRLAHKDCNKNKGDKIII